MVALLGPFFGRGLGSWRRRHNDGVGSGRSSFLASWYMFLCVSAPGVVSNACRSLSHCLSASASASSSSLDDDLNCTVTLSCLTGSETGRSGGVGGGNDDDSVEEATGRYPYHVTKYRDVMKKNKETKTKNNTGSSPPQCSAGLLAWEDGWVDFVSLHYPICAWV